MSRRSFLCLDCGTDTGRAAEYYMLRNEVWDAAHTSRKGMLCIGCIEARLGRDLAPEDFSDCFVNRDAPRQSLRLRSRLERVAA